MEVFNNTIKSKWNLDGCDYVVSWARLNVLQYVVLFNAKRDNLKEAIYSPSVNCIVASDKCNIHLLE